MEAGQLNVDEIIQKIRERIEKRKKTPQYSRLQPFLSSQIIRPPLSEELDNVKQALERCRACSSLRVRQNVATNKPGPVRPLFLKIRRILQAEVRWGLEPIAEQQEQFNQEAMRALESLAAAVGSGLERIESQIDDLKREFPTFTTSLGDMKHKSAGRADATGIEKMGD